ncbi:hypothetical protein CTI14_58175, partial [Methylobacterium radiotolerans]
MSQTLSEFDAKAAESGNKATERFKESGKRAALEVPQERVSLLAREVLEAVYATIRTHKVTYDEYNALKEWLIHEPDPERIRREGCRIREQGHRTIQGERQARRPR